jgi:CobQ/CobB/MinD/ParA nucleotide binding domain
MKKVHLILQSKGGVGKSLLTYFLANLFADDSDVLFCDVDESTKTSSERLISILPKERNLYFPILNGDKNFDRELFFQLFEKISKSSYNKIFVDFGAPESQEFRKLLEFEIDAKTLFVALRDLGIELILLVVIAGGDSYKTSYNYYQSLEELIGNALYLKAVMNQGTFGDIEGINFGRQNLTMAAGEDNVLFFGNLGKGFSSEGIKNMVKLAEKIDTKDPKMPFAIKLKLNTIMKEFRQLIDTINEIDN